MVGFPVYSFEISSPIKWYIQVVVSCKNTAPLLQFADASASLNFKLWRNNTTDNSLCISKYILFLYAPL